VSPARLLYLLITLIIQRCAMSRVMLALIRIVLILASERAQQRQWSKAELAELDILRHLPTQP